MIYLDSSATSFPKPPEVLDAVQGWFRQLGVDAARGSSARHEAVAAGVDRCRQRLAQICGVTPSHVVLCAGATHASNLILKGVLRPGDRVWTTALEHNAVVRPLVGLQRRANVRVSFFAPATARVEADQIAAALENEPPPDVFVFNHASNVTGVIQDFDRIAPALRAAGALLIADCAQTAGKLDLTRLDVDALIVPGHKGLAGPPGIGALCLRRDMDIVPLIEGGTGSSGATDAMPRQLPTSLEAGTPNTPAVLGLLAGLDWVLARGIDALYAEEMARMRTLRAALAPAHDAGKLRLIGADGTTTHTAVLSVTFPNLDPTEAALILEADGILTRAGFHCAPYIHEHIGTAAAGTLRLSPGPYNTDAEMVTVAQRLATLD